MLIEHDLFRGRIDKVAMAIERIKTFEPPEGYYVADSFGKDSCAIVRLTEMSGVRADYHYNLTTVDPPELVWFGKKHHPNTIIKRPDITMWKLIVKKRMPPTRLKRYCCEYFKENHGSGRLIMTGIRAEESAKRAKRQMVESCYKDTTKKYLHPIIDWTSKDVWEFIKTNNIPYCKLYDEGFKRIGCVMCPYSNIKQEAKRFPKIAEAYHRAVLKCFTSSVEAGNSAGERFKDGEEMWQWWLSGKGKTEDGGLFT